MEEPFKRLIHQNTEKGERYYLTVNEFRDVHYLHIRKYYQDFEGEFVPTKEGISFPLNIRSTLSLFLALSEIMSDAEISLISEPLQSIIEYYKSELYEPD